MFFPIFDIERYVTTAKNFDTILKNITSEYEHYSQEISLEDPQSILRKIKDFGSRIDDLKKKLVSEKSSIDSTWEEYVNATKDFISNIKDILKLFQKLSLDVREIMNQLDVIQRFINIKCITELNLELSKLEKIKHEVQDALYESLKKVLTDDELRLIEFLVKKLRREGRKWLLVEEVYQFAKTDLQMDSSKVAELLKKLATQGILKEGITLAF